MKKSPFPRLWPAALLLAIASPAIAALAPGGTAYTKKFETNLLAEPSALAAVNAKVPYGRALKVSEARGAWFKVADGAKAGWVFAGNLSATQPAQGTGLSLDLSASATSATAAARPLAPATDEYAAQRNLGRARDDLNWLLAQCHAFTPKEVEAFLKEQKKGEYQ